GAEKPGLSAVVLRGMGKVAVYVAGAAIPFLLWMAYLYLSFAGVNDVSESLRLRSAYYHAPNWISDFSQSWFGHTAPIAWFYLILFFLLFGASLLLSANANSLHRLYRDRLSKAFLFDPTRIEGRFPGSRSRSQVALASVP